MGGKKQNNKYGHLYENEAHATSQDRLLVYCKGPYKIRREGQDDPLILKYLTMIDPVTAWVEIVQYSDKQESTIANLVDQTR